MEGKCVVILLNLRSVCIFQDMTSSPSISLRPPEKIVSKQEEQIPAYDDILEAQNPHPQCPQFSSR
jgi:hypothetical protein